MKIRNFFALILASVIFVACSNEDDDNGGVVKNPQGKAWLSLSIKSSTGSQLRGLNGTDREMGTTDETEVKAVRAIFFDQLGVVTEEIDLSSLEAAPGQPTGTAGEAFEVNAAAKNVMIIVNPPNGFPSFTSIHDYDDVNTALTLSVADVTGSTYGFMMTNSKGALEPSIAGGGLKDIDLYTTKALAESSPMSINVDRVVAKVRLNAATPNFPTDVNVTNIEWLLNVTNKKFFPLSERVKTKKNTTTPFDQYGLGSFRIDPNYDHIADGLTYPGSGYDGSYTYYTEATPPTASDWLLQASGVSVYCHENTQDSAGNSYAYVTHMLVKAEYIPKNFVNVDSSLLASTPGEDWMRISGRFYNYTSLMTYIDHELTQKFASADPTTYSTPRTNALNNYLDSIGAGKVDISTGPAAPLIAAFNGKQGAVAAAGARSHGSFNYYKNAINYYRIAIKHDDDGGITNDLGEFGVVRNSVYDVKINSINNPGLPAIPEPKPTDPIEADGSYLSVEININPWTWYSQVEDL